MSSYTLIAGTANPKAIQFCGHLAALDMNVMKLAKDTYGKFVCVCGERGKLGHL